MIKISGIIEQSMGKFICLRGFAPIKDLEGLSVTNESIQRDLITSHEGEMRKFLEERDGTFFPEVILSTNLANTEFLYKEDDVLLYDIGDFDNVNEAKYDKHTDEISQIVSSVTNRQEMKKCQLGALNLSINYAKSTSIHDSITVKHNDSATSKSNASKVLVGNLYIDENKLKNKFVRIDGNHRLSAAKGLDDKYNYYTPFCLVLFTSSENQNRFSTLFFHNINYKQIPIAKEHNLKIIIDSALYSDEELITEFGDNYKLTRFVTNIVSDLDLSHFVEVNKLIGENRFTYFVELIELLLIEGLISKTINEEEIVELFKVQLSKINAALLVCKCSAKSNIAVLGALSFYLLQDLKKYYAFLNWVDKNDITSIKNLKISEVISIYDKIYANIPKKVFLARWYPATTDKEYKRAARRLDAITEVVKIVFGLELIDIGTQEGGTFSIRETMYSEISSSDIFIADLTGARHNVMVEVGYALKNVGLGKMLFYFQPNDQYSVPPFDVNGFKYEQIEDSADIKEVIPKHISAILEESLMGNL